MYKKKIGRSLFRPNYKNRSKTYLDYLWESDYSKRTKVYYTKELKDLVKLCEI